MLYLKTIMKKERKNIIIIQVKCTGLSSVLSSTSFAPYPLLPKESIVGVGEGGSK